jgi:transcriptional regulator with XRE-family HTH domain
VTTAQAQTEPLPDGGIVRELIKEARRAAGISQVELARRIGSSQSTIGMYETGDRHPAVGALIEVIRGCGFELELRLVKDSDETSWSQWQETIRQKAQEIAEMCELTTSSPGIPARRRRNVQQLHSVE